MKVILIFLLFGILASASKTPTANEYGICYEIASKILLPYTVLIKEMRMKELRKDIIDAVSSGPICPTDKGVVEEILDYFETDANNKQETYCDSYYFPACHSSKLRFDPEVTEKFQSKMDNRVGAHGGHRKFNGKTELNRGEFDGLLNSYVDMQLYSVCERVVTYLADNNWEIPDADTRRFCPITEETATFIKDVIECEMNKEQESKEKIIKRFCQENNKNNFINNEAEHPCENKGLNRAVQPPPPSPYVSY